jgi:hypothetical protein
MDKRTFQEQMAYLAAAYSKEITKEMAAVYWDQLGGLQDEAFIAAVRQTVGHSQWFPTVAELRRNYRDELRRQRMARGRVIEHRKVDREAALAALADIRRRIGK